MQRKKIIFNFVFIALLFLSITNPLFPQDNRTCSFCKKAISGSYIKPEGNTFHPEHFICSYCNKVIEGSYQIKDEKFLHPDCFALAERMICDYCEKIFNTQFLVSGDKKYHKECYEKYVVARCSICREPLLGNILIDYYNNKYHAKHKDEFDKCDCCSRLICQPLTGGGKDYSDGRHICNLCYASAIFDNKRINELLGRVIYKLKTFGLNLDEKRISIAGVDRNVLRNKSRSYSEKTEGFCDSQTETELLNNRIIKQLISHKIYVLSGVPAGSIELTIAHELMHAWLYENTKNNHSDKVREGSCNYIGYIYLKSATPNNYLELIVMLEKDPDQIYGNGFRELKSKYEGKQISELLAYLKK